MTTQPTFYSWASTLADAEKTARQAEKWYGCEFSITEEPTFEVILKKGKRLKERVQTGTVYRIWKVESHADQA